MYFGDDKDVYEKPVKRVNPGEVLSDTEIGRRLALQLQLPKSYSTRLYAAWRRVIADAIEHGEGIKIPGAGSIVIQKFKTPMVYSPSHKADVERINWFRIKFSVFDSAKDKLIKYTQRLKDEGKTIDSI